MLCTQIKVRLCADKFVCKSVDTELEDLKDSPAPCCVQESNVPGFTVQCATITVTVLLRWAQTPTTLTVEVKIHKLFKDLLKSNYINHFYRLSRPRKWNTIFRNFQRPSQSQIEKEKKKGKKL